MELLQAEKLLGRLKLVDLNLKNQAIKCAWVFRTDPYVVNQISHLIPNALGTYFWDCNMNIEDLNCWLKNVGANAFWTCVLRNWFKFTWQINTTHDVHTIIWLNSGNKSRTKTYLLGNSN